MIRVLQFADVINRFDFIETLVNYADPAEFEMSVCVRTEDHNISRPEFGDGVKYKLLPGNSRKDALSTAWKLSQLLKEWQIDVLHAHHFEQIVVGWLATKINPATKLIVGRHYSDSIYRNPNASKRKLLLAFEQKINRDAARIIVPSKMIAEILTDRQGVDEEKVDIVHYGFVPEKYAAVTDAEVETKRSELAMEGRFVVGNFSRLHEEKGHRYLLEAAAIAKEQVPNLLVLIVGEGSERQDLERRISELGLNETVRLLGWRTDAMAIMSAVDAVAQSTLQEAFSQVMCEAMWLARPLVMTDVSGVRDIIADGENGLIVPKADPEGLAAAIVRVAGDAELRSRLGANGRRFVGEKLTIDKMIGYYEDSFRKARDQRGVSLESA
jgi:glycosyltransferase involved in cell wall biosynthesis